FRSHPLYFEEEQFLLLEGKVQKKEKSVQFIAEKAKPLNKIKMGRKQPHKQTLYLKIDKKHQRSEVMVQVKESLWKFQGNADVILYYEQEKKTLRLPKSFQVNPS